MFQIDYFSLMFLSEVVVNASTIARHSTFESFSDTHYHKMNENEKIQFFEYVIKLPNFDLENEDCRHFFARFNPKNQFVIKCFYNGVPQEIEAYRFNEGPHRTRCW